MECEMGQQKFSRPVTLAWKSKKGAKISLFPFSFFFVVSAGCYRTCFSRLASRVVSLY
jgi:hypothetical protein